MGYNPLEDEYSQLGAALYMKGIAEDNSDLVNEARKANIWNQPSIDEMKPWAGYRLGKGAKEDKWGMFNLPPRDMVEQISMLAEQQRPFVMSGPLADRVEAAEMLRSSMNYNTPYNTYYQK